MKQRKMGKWLALTLSALLSVSAAVQPSLAFVIARSQTLLNSFVPLPEIESGLVISKTVEHPFDAEYIIPDTIAFDFEVNLGEYYAGYTLTTTQGDMTADENGMLYVSLKPNAYFGVENLNDGMQVTVTERQTDGDGFAVKDDAASQTVTISADDTAYADFVNIYTPAPVQPALTVDGQKVLEGREWQEGDEFTFILEREDENGDWVSMGTKSVAYDAASPDFAAFSFTDLLEELEFSAVGSYEFRMSEVPGSLEHMTYDGAVSRFTIIVTDEDMDGSLEIADVVTTLFASVEQDAETGAYAVNVTFTNVYEEPEETTTTEETTTEETTTTTEETTTTTEETTTTTEETTTTTEETTTTTEETTTTTEETTTTTEETTTTTEETTTTTEETTTTTEETTTTTEETTTTTEETSTTEESTTTEETTTTEPTTTEPVRYEYEVEGKDKFYFSHDPRPFSAEDLIETVTRYAVYSDGTVATEGEVVEDWSTLEIAFDVEGWTNPEEVFNTQVLDENGNAPEDYNVCYVGTIPCTITDEVTGERETIESTGTAYIAVKGDVNFDGNPDANDSTLILIYAAQRGAGNEAYLYSGDADQQMLEYFAYFLGDVTGESENYGEDGSGLDANDSTYILIYAARAGAGLKPLWEEVLNDPLPIYTAAIAEWNKAHAQEP